MGEQRFEQGSEFDPSREGRFLLDRALDTISIVKSTDETYLFHLSTDRFGACGGTPGWEESILHASDEGQNLLQRDVTITCLNGEKPADLPGFRLSLIDDGDVLVLEPLVTNPHFKAHFHRISAD